MPKTLDSKAQMYEFILVVVRYLFRDEPNSPVLHDIERIEWDAWPEPGIREAVGDAIEWSQDISGDDLAAVDDQLASAGLPTLSQVRESWQPSAPTQR